MPASTPSDLRFARPLAASRVALVLLLCLSPGAQATGVGHYDGSLLNVRDQFMPAHGVHLVLYNRFYSTDRLNDAQGEKVDQVIIHPPPGPSPGIAFALDVDVKAYVAAPTLILVKELKPGGLKLGASITPTLPSTDLDAALATANDRSGAVHGGSIGVGDLFVRPVWLGISTARWELGGSYGFYAPTGQYETRLFSLPVGQPIKTVSPDNLGHGFWTHQLQGVLGWYPTPDPRTALMSALTYEVNGKKDGFDVTPGANLSLNWGASQILPGGGDPSLKFELGAAGYDTWQVSDDTGADARTVRSQVHAAGWQLGFTHAPSTFSVQLHGFYEYSAKSRLVGSAYGLSLGKKL